MRIHDVEQSTREWMQLHVGIPTAGGLDNLLTPEFEIRKGETPKTYIFRKVAEAWRGKPMIDLGGSSFAMEQGMILESEAIPFWELTTGRKVTRVGFITTDDGRFGCSPDGILTAVPVLASAKGTVPCPDPETEARESTPVKTVTKVECTDSRGGSQKFNCGIEIKCPAPHTHVKYLTEGVVPKEYRAQIQGGMFATGWEKWIFFSYCRAFPPLILEVLRDDRQQKAIADAIENFHAFFALAKKSIERWNLNPMNEFKHETHPDSARK